MARIRIKIKANGKTETKEKKIRDKAHLEAQIKYPQRIRRNKKRYQRSAKHKGKIDYD